MIAVRWARICRAHRTHSVCVCEVGESVLVSSLLQIRGVPDETRRRLKARAATRGQSLNAYLLELVDREVARPTVAEVLHRAAQRAERANRSALEIVESARAEHDDRRSGRHDA